MDIFKFDNYKEFIQKWVENQPSKGRGLYAKIADSLNISSVLVSQIFKGDKNLSLEHAYLLTEFLALTSDEKDYFILLVEYNKAGSQKLQNYFQQKIKTIQKKKSENLKEILAQDISLSENDKAIFYSNWLYSAVRLQTSIQGFETADKLAAQFQLPREQILEILRFLVDKNLCIKTPNGFQMGPQRTHLESTSPYIKARQVSWRVKAFEKMDKIDSSQFFYTAPMSISEEQFKKLRDRLTSVIKELTQDLINDEPERLACLNIDLFRL